MQSRTRVRFPAPPLGRAVQTVMTVEAVGVRSPAASAVQRRTALPALLAVHHGTVPPALNANTSLPSRLTPATGPATFRYLAEPPKDIGAPVERPERPAAGAFRPDLP